MQYTNQYVSPLGNILLAADEDGLTGLWFEGQKYYGNSHKIYNENHPDSDSQDGNISVFTKTKAWLNIYFSGREPDFCPPLHMTGTPFQIAVWKILQKIPYGETTTYGEIAREIAAQKGISRMSAQAVGGAVGHNKISIMVPCHRVVGSSGSLTGYAGGIDRKVKLLTLEKADMSAYFVPREGTAL